MQAGQWSTLVSVESGGGYFEPGRCFCSTAGSETRWQFGRGGGRLQSGSSVIRQRGREYRDRVVDVFRLEHTHDRAATTQLRRNQASAICAWLTPRCTATALAVTQVGSRGPGTRPLSRGSVAQCVAFGS